MLTINNILKLYGKGVDIVITNKPSKISGEWDLSSLIVFLYKRNIKSKEERDITLIHELTHAKEDLVTYRSKDDEAIEEKAIRTNFKKPYLIELVKDLFMIDY